MAPSSSPCVWQGCSSSPASLGVDPKSFLLHYWQQKPLLSRQAFPGTSFSCPIEPRDVLRLAAQPEADARLIIEEGRSQTGPLRSRRRHPWQVVRGPILEEAIAKAKGKDGKGKWTVLVNDLEVLALALPDQRGGGVWASQLLNAFGFLPHCRIDDVMVSYAPVGGSVGPHVDSYDVFLLQARGVREWSIENEKVSLEEEERRLVAGADARVLKDFKADVSEGEEIWMQSCVCFGTMNGQRSLRANFRIWSYIILGCVEQETWSLKSGDMLYLPPRVAHHGISMSDDCMTLSIGFRSPGEKDVVTEYLHDLLEKYSSPKRKVPSNCPRLLCIVKSKKLADFFLFGALIQNVLYEDTVDERMSSSGVAGELPSDMLEWMGKTLSTAILPGNKDLSTDPVLRKWIGRFLTSPRRPELMDDLETLQEHFYLEEMGSSKKPGSHRIRSRHLSADEISAKILDGITLYRSSIGHFSWFQPSENDIELYVGGQQYTYSKSLKSAVIELCKSTPLDITLLLQDLDAEGQKMLVQLCVDLVHRGFLIFGT